ncbi:MAG TPA: hypothetical protein VKU90_06785 [Caulobacteraceae bacterium]|nr:hypothetical protein [Caulobacteraceae bacterium]
MKRTLLIAAVAMAAAGGASAAAPPSDGFAAFYKLFAAAAAKDDQKALAAFTVLAPSMSYGDGPLTFATVHEHYLTAKLRRCLATGKPKRDIDGTGAVNYFVFCGNLIYDFTKPTPAGWRWTDLSPDD